MCEPHKGRCALVLKPRHEYQARLTEILEHCFFVPHSQP